MPNQGKVYEKELALQCSGYFDIAEGMLTFDAQGSAIGIEPMPHVDRWGGLYLGDDGKATLIEVPKPHRGDSRTREQRQADASAAFRHLLAVRHWARPTKQIR